MYLALYRKWRPEKFTDVLSQDHITNTLQNQVKSGKTAHAYLFTGSRGTGKTTCAKILAMAFNCVDLQDGNPCLKCPICKSILDGSSNLDVLEIDAASNNGVDNIRQLREEALYLPVMSKYRVYIIDETHMLSVGAFNALLKIMEEPPAHVKFILATTEVHKVPATILSRCQRFDFHRIKLDDIINRIMFIANEENITLSFEAANAIARLSDGGMRDAISILDQCYAYSTDITQETVSLAVGITPREYLFSVTDYIIENNTVACLELLNKLYNESKDIQSFCEELIMHFRNLLIILTSVESSNCDDIIQVLPDELEKLKEIKANKSISFHKIISIISILQETLDNIGKFSDKRLTMEICLIRLTTQNLIETKIVAQVNKKELSQSPRTIESEKIVETQQYNSSTQTQQNQKKPLTLQEEDTNLTIFNKWPEVLSALIKTDKYIYGIVHNANVYVKDEFLYVESPIPTIASLLKKEGTATRLIKVIEEVTNIRYKIRLKKQQVVQEDNVDPLDELQKNLLDSGVIVNEI